LGPYSSKPSQQPSWEHFGRFLFYIYRGVNGKVENESVGVLGFFFPLFSMGTAPQKLLKLMAGNFGINKRQGFICAWDIRVALTTQQSERQALCFC